MVWITVSLIREVMDFPREENSENDSDRKFKKSHSKFIIILLYELTRLLSKEAIAESR